MKSVWFNQRRAHACQSRRSLLLPRPVPWLRKRPCTNFLSQGTITAATQTERPLEDQKYVPLTDSKVDPSAAVKPSSTFPWTSCWYPVAVVDDLDPKRPHAAHLLGISLALWRDKEGHWHAVEDKCPHRLAPLSEGRIESDGTLQCAYHGWQFDGRGSCTHIPQLRNDPKAMQVACSSQRSCVRSFPAQVVHGLLWVLPDSSPEAHEQFSKESSLPKTAVKELLGGPESEGYRQTTQWFARDVPMRFDTMCENILDPSHVPFAHHKVQGNRNSEKGTMTTIRGDVTMEGFEFELDGRNPRFGTSVPVFTAPNYVRYGNPFRSLNVFMVPTRPGWSRIYATFLKGTQKKGQPSRIPWMFEKIYSLIEKTTWLEHISQRHPVLDGDNYMLHVQERFLHEHYMGNWQKNYYMPAPADTSVVAIRSWFDKYGGVIPTCEPGTPLPPRLTKREALDRYSQHTVHCRHCQKALRTVDFATVAAAAAGVLTAVWLAARALLGAPLVAPASAAGLLAVALAGAVVAGLRSLRQQFFFVDYVHAERN